MRLCCRKRRAQVALVEQEPHLGGSMNYHAFDRDYETTKSARDALVAAVKAHENIDVLSHPRVTPGLVITTYRSFKKRV